MADKIMAVTCLINETMCCILRDDLINQCYSTNTSLFDFLCGDYNVNSVIKEMSGAGL